MSICVGVWCAFERNRVDGHTQKMWKRWNAKDIWRYFEHELSYYTLSSGNKWWRFVLTEANPTHTHGHIILFFICYRRIQPLGMQNFPENMCLLSLCKDEIFVWFFCLRVLKHRYFVTCCLFSNNIVSNRGREEEKQKKKYVWKVWSLSIILKLWLDYRLLAIPFLLAIYIE